MASYKLLIKRDVEKEIRALPKKEIRRIVERIYTLCDQPRPMGCEKLQGDLAYRVRQGDYRIIYTIDDRHHTIRIMKVGHRREVYR